MDYRDNRQRWAESHQVVHFYAGQWCTFTPALTLPLAVRSGEAAVAKPGALAKGSQECRHRRRAPARPTPFVREPRRAAGHPVAGRFPPARPQAAEHDAALCPRGRPGDRGSISSFELGALRPSLPTPRSIIVPWKVTTGCVMFNFPVTETAPPFRLLHPEDNKAARVRRGGCRRIA